MSANEQADTDAAGLAVPWRAIVGLPAAGLPAEPRGTAAAPRAAAHLATAARLPAKPHLASEASLPAELQLEPVAGCNLRCPMCLVTSESRRGGDPSAASGHRTVSTTSPAPADSSHRNPLTLASARPHVHSQMLADPFLLARLLTELPDLRLLHLQGLGEPLLHPRLFEMVVMAKAAGVWVSTSTNATLLDARRADECIASGLDRLHISIDAASRATYAALRPGADLDAVLANVTRLVAIRDGAGLRAPRIHLVAVVMRRTLPQLPSLVGLAAGIGADELFVQHLCHGLGDAARDSCYAELREFVARESLVAESPARVHEWFAAAQIAAQRFGVRLRLPRPPAVVPDTPPASHLEWARERRSASTRACSWPFERFYVTAAGELLPCCMIGSARRLSFGSVLSGGLTGAWSGAEAVSFRASLGRRETAPDICRSCAVFDGTF